MQRSITLKDIAEKAGVSKTTASFCFSGTPGVAAATRELVLEVARQYNYKPNHFARALNTKRTQTIGAVFANTLGDFMGQIVKGIETVAWEHGYQMLLTTCHNDQEREKSHIETLLHKGVDGLMVFMVSPEDGQKLEYSHLVDLKKKNVPLVLMDRYLPGEDMDYVVTDDLAGSYEAVRYLIQLGHKRIAYVSRSEDCSSVRNRLEGYRKALLDAGLEARSEYVVTNRLSSPGGACKAVEPLFQLAERPTAIFTATDGEAVAALRVAKSRGLRVPQDLAVVGFGDSPLLDMLEVPLTTMDQPTEQIGRHAAQILIDRMANREEQDKPRQVLIKPALIVRKSCGGPASGDCSAAAVGAEAAEAGKRGGVSGRGRSSRVLKQEGDSRKHHI